MDKQELKSRYPMNHVLKLYSIPIIKGKILCPFHGEKTPSCSVHTEHIYCHSCCESADIFKLSAHMNGMDIKNDFSGVLKRFCEDVGETYENDKTKRKPKIDLVKEKKARIAKYFCRLEKLNLADYHKSIYPFGSEKWVKAAETACYITLWMDVTGKVIWNEIVEEGGSQSWITQKKENLYTKA